MSCYRDNTRTRTNPKNHVAARCTADRVATRNAPSAAATRKPWEMRVGYVKIAILGPADHQWFSASKPHYSGPVGSPMERAVAQRAVCILNRDHPGDETIGRPQIDAIIARAAVELKTA